MWIGSWRLSHKAEARHTCRALLPNAPSSRAQLRVIFVPRVPTGTPITQTFTLVQSAPHTLARSRPSIRRLTANQILRMVSRGIKGAANPVVGSTSSTSLAQDFVRQQVSKQQRSNFHSTSISPLLHNKMVTQTVNKTNLHPSGVA